MSKVRVQFWGGPWDGGEIWIETANHVNLPRHLWARTRVMVPNGEDYHVFQPDLALLNAHRIEGSNAMYVLQSQNDKSLNYLWDSRR